MSWKRGMDLCIASAALLLLWPLMLILALLIRIKLGSPVLFVQTRPGRHAKPFTLYKFRTMADLRDANGCLLPDGDRLLPFGRLLRKYSLDELPQLLNVLLGDLSLVGPRPLLMRYLPRYSAEQARRHEVRPGITGWAQVNGRNCLSWDEKFRFDVWYVDHCSFWLDMRILWKTALQLIRPQGISSPGHATMPEFTGSIAAAPTGTIEHTAMGSVKG